MSLESEEGDPIPALAESNQEREQWIAAVFDEAVREHLAGRMEGAERLLRRILEVQPDHAEALHHLGLAKHLQGCSDEAGRLIRESLALSPGNPAALSNLGEILRSQGHVEEAVGWLRKAVELSPESADVCNNLGLACWGLGLMEEAGRWCGRAVSLRPDYPEALNNWGIALQGLGRLEEAIDCFRKALALQPAYAGALNNLGNTLKRAGRLDEAIESYRAALAASPSFVEVHNNLGNACRERGDLAEAEHHCRTAVILRPDYAVAWNNLGNALKDLGNLDEATACYRRALAIEPGSIEANLNLGIALRDLGLLEEATVCLTEAAMLHPDSASAHNHLGVALQESGRLEEAVKEFSRAIEIDPAFSDAWNHMGIVTQALGGLSEAAALFRRAIAIKPENAGAWNNLGIVLQNSGHLGDAIECYRRAFQLDPSLGQAGNNLGIALADIGRIDEAVASYRETLRRHPAFADSRSNLLLILQYSGLLGPGDFLAEARRWDECHARVPVGECMEHHQDRDPDRRLRIGYVSADFRRHSVSFFLEGLLARHDPEAVEIFAYSDVAVPDVVTARLRSLTHHWRSTVGLSSSQFAEMVVTDRIDILVDLAGHTAGNRLLSFARKPAPVQVTWLGFPNTTGLSAMDWRLTDGFAEGPEDLDAACYAERQYRLPSTFLCYRPDEAAPPVAPLPDGPVVFGCFNSPAKVNPEMIGLWARLLKRIPGSRLLLKNYAVADPANRRRLLDLFGSAGIESDRVDLVLKMSSFQEHMALYHRIHIALDTFPYHGTTTTCEALWMGVPVMTLAGTEHRSRVGVSLLSQIGLSDWVADCPENYVEQAVRLAAEGEGMREIRSSMRGRMRASPLMDEAAFARDVEDAYRFMWRSYCGCRVLRPD